MQHGEIKNKHGAVYKNPKEWSLFGLPKISASKVPSKETSNMARIVIPGMEKLPTRFCGSIMFNSLSCWVNSPFIVDETTIWNPQRLVPNQYYIMPAKLLVPIILGLYASPKYEVKHVNGAWFGQWVYHIFRVYTSWPLWVWSILWVIYAH